MGRARCSSCLLLRQTHITVQPFYSNARAGRKNEKSERENVPAHFGAGLSDASSPHGLRGVRCCSWHIQGGLYELRSAVFAEEKRWFLSPVMEHSNNQDK